MLVSLSWLRELCPVDTGPDEVARALTERGLTVDAVTGSGDDVTLDVDVPANRPDCLGHLGVARELGAAFGIRPAPRPAMPAGEGEPVTGVVRISIDAPDLCARYTAGLVRNVRVGPSPAWVERRLEACGLRPINNVVDASNLVLLELGHPIHAFDLERLQDGVIRVREARSGETLVTLEGEPRVLDEGMLVIADGRRPVALAGILGGADSEIEPRTTNVLIEAAAFQPRSVRATARRLGIKTEASHRFERGVDAESALQAQALAMRWLAELAGGRPAPEVVDLYPRPQPRRELTVRRARTRVLLGFDPGPDEMRSSLAALGLSPKVEPDDNFRITVPSWRPDLEREADVVEEIARHLGYGRIPSHLPPAPGAPVATEPAQRMEERARDLTASHGFHEAFNYAMIGRGEDGVFVEPGAPSAIVLQNPIAEPLAALRRSLLPGLLRCADLNLRRGTPDVRLFEVGRVFLGRGPGELPDERLRLGIAWAGSALPRHWSTPGAEASFHDLSGLIRTLLDGLRPGPDYACVPGSLDGLHPGRSARWLAGGDHAVAWGGELHPEIRRGRDLAATMLLAEIDLSALLSLPSPAARHRPLPRVPAVTRDLSLILEPGLHYERVRDVLGEVPAPAPVALEVVDRYTGAGIPEGHVSLTVRVILQPPERSLTEPEIEAYRAKLVRALETRLGLRLRS